MRKDSGFTLVELLVTISVAAILMTVGIPSMIEFVKTNRRAGAVNALVSEIQRGRSVAASRGVAAVLCHSDDGATCSGDAGPDWADGWILFQDTDGDNTLDAGETVSVSRGMDGVTMPSSRTSFRFAPGFQLSGFGGTVGVCIEKSNASARWIALSNLGRPRLKDAFEAGDPDCVTAGP